MAAVLPLLGAFTGGSSLGPGPCQPHSLEVASSSLPPPLASPGQACLGGRGVRQHSLLQGRGERGVCVSECAEMHD